MNTNFSQLKRSLLALVCMGILGLSAHTLTGQDLALFQKKEIIEGTDTLRYRILYPENYNANQKYPLVLFLHGAGERGNDNEAQLKHGSKLFLQAENRRNFPAIVIFPQCPKNSYWSSLNVKRKEGKQSKFEFPYDKQATASMNLSIKLVQDLLDKGLLDEKRIYISGLSMGGFGTFEALVRHPNLFAAAMPICGGGSVKLAKVYAKKLPLWIFHGEVDSVVPVELSRNVYNKLKALGADVKYTEYPGVNHNSWDNAFAEPEYLPWMFAQQKK